MPFPQSKMARDVETGERKDNEKRMQKYKMEEQDKFISRSYWLCATLFFLTGIAMVTAVLQGLYKEIALAQTLMITVFGVSYMIILMIMCFCRNNDTLRVPFLLFISFFIGIISGFMVGVNLKMVIEHLQD